MRKRMGEWARKLSGCKYVILVGAVGLLLLLWPAGRSADTAEDGGEESRVAELLSQMEGVGETSVLLSEAGAVVVCEGGGNASVRLRVTRAVRCYTGLGADEIEIFKME